MRIYHWKLLVDGFQKCHFLLEFNRLDDSLRINFITDEYQRLFAIFSSATNKSLFFDTKSARTILGLRKGVRSKGILNQLSVFVNPDKTRKLPEKFKEIANVLWLLYERAQLVCDLAVGSGVVPVAKRTDTRFYQVELSFPSLTSDNNLRIAGASNLLSPSSQNSDIDSVAPLIIKFGSITLDDLIIAQSSCDNQVLTVNLSDNIHPSLIAETNAFYFNDISQNLTSDNSSRLIDSTNNYVQTHSSTLVSSVSNSLTSDTILHLEDGEINIQNCSNDHDSLSFNPTSDIHFSNEGVNIVQNAPAQIIDISNIIISNISSPSD